MSCAKSCRAGLKCWAYNPESDMCYESGEETDRPSPLSVSAWTGTTALFRKKYLTAAHARCIIIMFQVCRCDGIGRRSGLKIHRWRQRAGSSPATGTRSDGCESLFSHPFFCIAMVITACTQKRTTAVFFSNGAVLFDIISFRSVGHEGSFHQIAHADAQQFILTSFCKSVRVISRD